MLHRLIYSSRSLCTAGEISALLEDARRANERMNVTGSLYLSGGTFLQYLEGEQVVVDKLFDRITCDRRHAECNLLDRRPISSRIFKNWSMAWLPQSPNATLLMKTLLADNETLHKVDGTPFGSFFYAMAHAGECR